MPVLKMVPPWSLCLWVPCACRDPDNWGLACLGHTHGAPAHGGHPPCIVPRRFGQWPPPQIALQPLIGVRETNKQTNALQLQWPVNLKCRAARVCQVCPTSQANPRPRAATRMAPWGQHTAARSPGCSRTYRSSTSAAPAPLRLHVRLAQIKQPA